MSAMLPRRASPAKNWPALTGCVRLVLFGLFCLLPGLAGSSHRASVKPAPADELFNDDKIRTFRIEVAEPALSALQRDNRSYVRGTASEGGRTYRDVGVHLKGMGSFRPLNEKPSFVLKF